MSFENWCKHYTGLTHDTCEAGVRYKDVKDPSDQPLGYPCFKDKGCTHLCSQAVFLTEEEIAEKKKEIKKSLEENCKDKGKNNMDERELIKKMWDISIEGTYQDDLLKEAVALLKMWKELSWPSTSMVNSYHTAKKRMLDERTARFLEKEGKNG